MNININSMESALLQKGLSLLGKRLNERGFSDETVTEYNLIKELKEKIDVDLKVAYIPKVYVKISDNAEIEKLKEVLSCHGGNAPVYIYNKTTEKLKEVEQKYWVNPDRYLFEDVSQEFGEGNIHIV